jgi:DNA replication factor GINS
MNLEELQAARDRERQTDKLQQLRETFYADAGEFIQQLQAERDRAAERAEDPFDSPEVSQLTDKIDTAEQTVEAIYEKRVGKIVKAASFAAADLPAEADGMTREEQDLFDTLVENIKSNRRHVLAVLDGEESESGDGTEAPTAPEPDVSAADLMGAGEETATDSEPSEEISAPAETRPPGASAAGAGPPEPATGEHSPAAGDKPPAKSQQAGRDMSTHGDGRVASAETDPDVSPETPTHQGDAVRNDGGQPTTADAAERGVVGTDSEPSTVQRRTVRITDDVETFVGSDDRDYDLDRDDIVTLPESNASLLIERGAAEQL